MKNILAKLVAIVATLATVASVPVHAQTPVSTVIVYRYNLSSLTEIYCALGGKDVPVADRVADATSTTMTAVSGTPFLSVGVGDMIFGNDQPASGGEPYTNSVVARASSSSITINTALAGEVNPTLTSANLSYRTLACGTGVNSGVFTPPGQTFTVQIDITQLVLGTPGVSTIDARVLCRASGLSQFLQVYPVLVPPAVTPSYVSLTVVGGWGLQVVGGPYQACRVGLKINAADDGGDTGTNAEQITIAVRGTSL